MTMRRRFAALSLLAIGLAACGTAQPVSTPSPSTVPGPIGPLDPFAEIRPDLMVVEPNPAAAGELVEVSYPGGRERGIAYVLERAIESTWIPTHFMAATTNGFGTAPSWVRIGDGGFNVEDIGFDNSGPDTLEIPSPLEPGEYRICTANTVENICAELMMVENGTPDVTSEPESSSVLGVGTSAPVVELLGLPLADFDVQAAELGFGPVRVAWSDGEYVPVAHDLQPGRVNVATETRDGVEIVIDARVEADTDTGTLEPESATPQPTTPEVTTQEPSPSSPVPSPPPSTGPLDGPYDPNAELRPDLMVIEPPVAETGQQLTVTYPGGRERGAAYVLEQAHGDGWSATHYLTATSDGYGTEPSWAAVGTENYGGEDIGFSGPGPDTLVIPEPAPAGDYRICTANSIENICAEVTVAERNATAPTTTAP